MYTYSGKITTLTKLTGSGAVTFKNYTVNITTLDNFSGTLTPIDATGTTIGTINLVSAPDAGDKIVALGEGAKVVIGSTKVSVNGVVDDTITLELESDGIYVAASVTPTIDPANPSAVEVTAADADAAIAAVALATPTGVDEDDYKALFDITATETSEGSGVYTVEVTGIKESVEEDVEESAMDVLDEKPGAKVQVPAGLYYKITTYTELGGTAVETVGGSEISDGTGVSVSKPGTTQGFIKIEMAPTGIN